MAAKEILSTKSTSRFSKGFYVPNGSVVVLTAYNFRCQEVDNKTLEQVNNTCAELHMIHFGNNQLPQGEGCCTFDIFDEELRPKFEYTELVAQCNNKWTLNSQNNIRILSVPGYYMFEVCDDKDIGSAVILAEEVTVKNAELLPRAIIFGDY